MRRYSGNFDFFMARLPNLCEGIFYSDHEEGDQEDAMKSTYDQEESPKEQENDEKVQEIYDEERAKFNNVDPLPQSEEGSPFIEITQQVIVIEEDSKFTVEFEGDSAPIKSSRSLTVEFEEEAEERQKESQKESLTMSKNSKTLRKEAKRKDSRKHTKNDGHKFCLKNTLKNQFCKGNQYVIRQMSGSQWKKCAEQLGVRLEDVKVFANVLQSTSFDYKFPVINNLWSGNMIKFEEMPSEIHLALIKAFPEDLDILSVAELYRKAIKMCFKRYALLSYHENKMRKTRIELISTVQALHRGIDRRNIGNHHLTLVSTQLEEDFGKVREGSN